MINKSLSLADFKSEFQECSEQLSKIHTDKDLQERILNLVEQFKGMSHDSILSYLEDFLPSTEARVFSNFHKNLTSFKNIITLYSNGQQPTNTELRNHFLNGQYINNLLFCDDYREILDYIQSDLSAAVKVEIFMDIQAYFSHGCYNEDKLNEPRLNKNLSPAKKFDLIKELSEKRNIGIKVKHHSNDRYSIECVPQQLSKSGMAKPGFIDRVKRIPGGKIVVLLGTSDGTLSLKNEGLQLREHIKSLCIGIENQQLVYNKKVYTLDDIHDISFNILTEYKSQKSESLQESMVDCGLNIETMRFLDYAFIPFLEEPCINDILKYRCSMNGIACNGISRSKIYKIDSFILETLQTINKNIGSIENLIQNGGRVKIKEFLMEFSSFLEKSQKITDFSNHEKILQELIKIQAHPTFSNLFPTGTSIVQLLDGFDPVNQHKKRLNFKTVYSANQIIHMNEQKDLFQSHNQEKLRINTVLESQPFNVNPLYIKQVIQYNLLNTFSKDEGGKKTDSKSILMANSSTVEKFNKLHKKLHKKRDIQAPLFEGGNINLTLAQRLWAKNNPSIINKIDPDFFKKNIHPFVINNTNLAYQSELETLIRDISFLHPNNSTPIIKHLARV